MANVATKCSYFGMPTITPATLPQLPQQHGYCICTGVPGSCYIQVQAWSSSCSLGVLRSREFNLLSACTSNPIHCRSLGSRTRKVWLARTESLAPRVGLCRELHALDRRHTVPEIDIVQFSLGSLRGSARTQKNTYSCTKQVLSSSVDSGGLERTPSYE